MANEPRDLLRRLASSDERSIETLLSPGAQCSEWTGQLTPGLSRRTRELVRLAALLAVDSSTSSLRWAVELASTAGVDDGAVVGALVSTAATTGWAQVVSSAPRLALALDLEPPP